MKLSDLTYEEMVMLEGMAAGQPIIPLARILQDFERARAEAAGKSPTYEGWATFSSWKANVIENSTMEPSQLRRALAAEKEVARLKAEVERLKAGAPTPSTHVIGDDGPRYSMKRMRDEKAKAVAYGIELAAALADKHAAEAKHVVQGLREVRDYARAKQVGAETVAIEKLAVAIRALTYEFDRYINGRLMAEGVTIERAKTLEEAMVIAARIASRGPNREVPVLVLRTPPPATREGVSE
jgi:hypothetical protein